MATPNEYSDQLMHSTHPYSANIYHERQSKQLCALHTLNNLFQDAKAFSKQDLDTICKELASDKFFNPHRSILGLGCYDVNVIIAALARKNYDVIWFDKRKNVDTLDFSKIFGLILNVPNTPSNGLFSLPLNYIPLQAQIWSSQKHWIAVKKIRDYYYNLDSKLNSPICIGNENDLLQHLKQNLLDQVEILIVIPKDVTIDDIWIKT